MVSNKNAYEIRTEILSMAQGHVMKRFRQVQSNWENSCDRHPETGMMLTIKDAPEYPSTDEVLKEAKNLYSFVDSQ